MSGEVWRTLWSSWPCDMTISSSAASPTPWAFTGHPQVRYLPTNLYLCMPVLTYLGTNLPVRYHLPTYLVIPRFLTFSIWNLRRTSWKKVVTALVPTVPTYFTMVPYNTINTVVVPYASLYGGSLCFKKRQEPRNPLTGNQRYMGTYFDTPFPRENSHYNF